MRIALHIGIGVFILLLSFPTHVEAASVCTCTYTRTSISSGTTSSENTYDVSTYEGATITSDTSCQLGCSAWADGKTTDSGGTLLYTITNTSYAATTTTTPAPTTTSTPTVTSRPLLTPTLSVDIPTVTFTDAFIKNDVLNINYLGDYIAGVYKYLLGIATTIAIVMIMVSGLQWTLGGTTPEAIGKAQTRIKNAVTGLVLLLCTYLILSIVNPNLINLQFPTLEIIQYEALVADSGDATGTTSTENLAAAGIDCPGSGDVATIAKSFLGKTTYRTGGKGGGAPYSAEKKIDSSGRPYSEYCPEGTVCLDCSGFVGIVAQCAGLASKNESSGTAGIFASAPRITSCGTDIVTLESGNTFTLTAGDLVGFKAGEYSKNPKNGHVWMYIGNGTLINSVGSGRISGTAVITQSLESACQTFPLRFIAR
ncbi:C40 family peptidase [Candidatus Uhrbacteria bacterium]|nr:C40 family peptidase [Candidatus Uhrbacteria bacterium]